MVQPPAPMNFSTSYYCNRFLVLVGFVGALALAGTVRAQSADDLGIYGFVSAFNVDCLFGSANSPGTTSTTENGYGGSATATATAYLSPLLGDLVSLQSVRRQACGNEKRGPFSNRLSENLLQPRAACFQRLCSKIAPVRE